jgi:hypothetical protein
MLLSECQRVFLLHNASTEITGLGLQIPNPEPWTSPTCKISVAFTYIDKFDATGEACHADSSMTLWENVAMIPVPDGDEVLEPEGILQEVVLLEIQTNRSTAVLPSLAEEDVPCIPV